MEEVVDVKSNESCGCGEGTPIQPSSNPAESIIVRHKPGITIGNVINKFFENGKTIYELDHLDIVNPVIDFTNDAGVRETGETVSVVTFNGEITQGTYPISSRSITPDPGGLNLLLPFSFQKTDVTRSTPGVEESHTVQAIDDQGGTTNKNSSVPFKDAIYQGFNSLATLDQAAIKALVNKHLIDTLIEEYGGENSYVVPGSPAGPKYIYWCAPIGVPVPTGAILNGLAFPLYTGHANINVTNIHDGGIIRSYWVVRSANRLDPDTYLITLS
jgi:hypothetical protein